MCRNAPLPEIFKNTGHASPDRDVTWVAQVESVDLFALTAILILLEIFVHVHVYNVFKTDMSRQNSSEEHSGLIF